MHSATEKNYTEIVLTGGPCGGKSSSLAHLTKELAERGIRTLCVPETATMLISGGLTNLAAMKQTEPDVYNTIQEQIILIQRQFRAAYQEIAESFAPEPVVILYDRAESDGLCYMGMELFNEVLTRNDLTIFDVRDSYDVVIHLVSAAKGAAEHYSTASNSARQESVEEAVVADHLTLQSWIGHPHLRIIDNSTDFEEKMRRVFQVVANAVGVETPIEIERWFLLAEPPALSDLNIANAQEILIEQTYLQSPNDSEIRVRSRTHRGQTNYYWTRKLDNPNGPGRIEEEALISYREYKRLLEERDESRNVVRKRRYCFSNGSTYCELDHFYELADPIWLLEVELIDENDEVNLPEYLTIEAEVTDDPRYKTSSIALSIS